MLPGFAQTAFSLARSSFPGEIDFDVGRIFLSYVTVIVETEDSTVLTVLASVHKAFSFARSSFSGGLDSDVNRLFVLCVTGFTETEDSCVGTLGGTTGTAFPFAGSSLDLFFS